MDAKVFNDFINKKWLMNTYTRVVNFYDTLYNSYITWLFIFGEKSMLLCTYMICTCILANIVYNHLYKSMTIEHFKLQHSNSQSLQGTLIKKPYIARSSNLSHQTIIDDFKDRKSWHVGIFLGFKPWIGQCVT